MAHGAAPDVSLVRPEVVAPLLIVTGTYAVGWWRLRRRGGDIAGWRVAASAAGWLSVLVALSSPFDRLAHASFAAHMTQHLLLIVVAAPLVLLADPFAALCWALPGPLRAGAGRLLRPGTALRGVWRALTTASVAWLAHAAAVLLLHVATAFHAAVPRRRSSLLPRDCPVVLVADRQPGAQTARAGGLRRPRGLSGARRPAGRAPRPPARDEPRDLVSRLPERRGSVRRRPRDVGHRRRR